MLFELTSGIFAHSSGALWLPGQSTLLVADLHLGYGLAQRRRGELGPLADEQTSAKLDALLQELAPAHVIFLGDTVHAPKPGHREKEWILEQWNRWCSRANLQVVRGNHDRAMDRDFQTPVCEQWRSPEHGIVAVHGDREWPEPAEGETLVLGHLHPAIRIRDAAGVKQKIPVFLVGARILILPAFSPFASGLDVWRRMPDYLLRFDLQAVAATGRRVAPIGPLSRLLSPAEGSTPRDFQRQRFLKG